MKRTPSKTAGMNSTFAAGVSSRLGGSYLVPPLTTMATSTGAIERGYVTETGSGVFATDAAFSKLLFIGWNLDDIAVATQEYQDADGMMTQDGDEILRMPGQTIQSILNQSYPNMKVVNRYAVSKTGMATVVDIIQLK